MQAGSGLLVSVRTVSLTALAYVAASLMVLLLGVPPSYASPLYPAAGIALAVALVLGRPGLVGIWLGALVAEVSMGSLRGLGLNASLLTGGPMSLGVLGQAALGAWLVRPRLAALRDLSLPRDALVFLALGGPVACLCSATVGVSSLLWVGAIPPTAALQVALAWRLGDTLGVLAVTLPVLTLIGQPRAIWESRRLTVGLPMLVLTVLLALATMLVTHSDDRRSQGSFEREALRAANAVKSGLHTPLHALESLRSLYRASDDVNATDFRLAVEPWLVESPSIAAMGYSVRLPRDQTEAFVQRVRDTEGRPYRIFNRADSAPALTVGDADVVAVLRIEPTSRNASALGVNALSVAAARAAIERAAQTDKVAVTEGFRLTQAVGDESGLVYYRALYSDAPLATAADRRAALSGVVFVTLRIEEAVTALLADVPGYLQWCLTDLDPSAARPRLAGNHDCKSPLRDDALEHLQALDVGGRHWQLSLRARKGDLPEEAPWTIWLFAATGLLSAAMLATLLLTITGRARRIEAAVAERAADLRREVGERRRAEQALRESEQRWRNIVDHIPIGVVYTDLAGRIRETNPKLCELLGMDSARVCQHSLAELTCPEDRAADAEQLRALMAGERSLVRQRVRLVRADGSLIWVQTGLSLLRDTQGKPLRVAGVVEDITEHLKLADAERARESAEAASRAKSEFLSRMSHELRTPLNAILGFSQLLTMDREPVPSQRQLSWTEQVQRAGWHLLSLINEMLDLSRIEAGQLNLDTTAVPVAAALHKSLAMVAQAAEQRGVRLDTSACNPALTAWADDTRLTQVLTNLLSNAVKYNRPGGQVRCAVRARSPGLVDIAVADDGQGLTAAQLSNLFQPFNRLGHEHGDVEGTGLGLVISRRLAEAMGGVLTAASTQGQGAVFTLTLPAAPEQDAATQAVPNLAGTDEPRYRTRHVLYIEDNETNAVVMEGILARRPQVRLTVAPTAIAGLAAISDDPPDLILLDMHLPDLDGLEVLRPLRAQDHTLNTPVVVVSADATTGRIEQAFALGATDYVTKPVDVTAFLARVDTYLEGVDTRF